MSSLFERIAAKSKTLVKRQQIDLPNYGETVVIRSLTQGAVMRAEAEGEALKVSAMIAFCVEDPATGELLFNWNDGNHRQVIHELDPGDTRLIADTFATLSGIGESSAELLGKSVPKESSSTFSPPGTVSSPPSLANASTEGSS